jgi:hypothetical protein
MEQDCLHSYIGQTAIYRTTVMLYLQNQNEFLASISFGPIAGQRISPKDLVIGPSGPSTGVRSRLYMTLSKNEKSDRGRPQSGGSQTRSILGQAESKNLQLVVDSPATSDESHVARCFFVLQMYSGACDQDELARSSQRHSVGIIGS